MTTQRLVRSTFLALLTTLLACGPSTGALPATGLGAAPPPGEGTASAAPELPAAPSEPVSTAAALDAGGASQARPAAKELRLHFQRPGSWPQTGVPHVYFWNVQPASATSRWPGEAMTPEGDGWFTYAIPGAESASLVFNNGGAPQTVDLTRTGEGWYDGVTWRSAGPNASKALRVHFKRPASWSQTGAPYVYFWNAQPGSATTRWPGEVMTAESDGWFTYAIPGADSASLVFNNGGAPQTSDLTRSGEGWYDGAAWGNVGPGAAQAPEVTASPAPGRYVKTVTVSLRSSPQVPVHYTLDPSETPTAASPTWSGDQTFTASTTLKVYVEAESQSRVQSFTYEIAEAPAYEVRENRTILQAFDWYIRDPSSETASYTAQPEPESNLWEYIAVEKAEAFYQNYFTHVWLPPTGKAFSPDTSYNNGYAVYDRYDLGEFDQMGRVRTKYGTKAQLLQAVAALKERKLKVVADVVMNHMLGGDDPSTVQYSVAYDSTRGARTEAGNVTAFVDFDFANAVDRRPRGTTYSAFKWTREHFSGMEAYQRYYLFAGKQLGRVNNFADVNWSDGRFDGEYQMLRSDVILGADIDLSHPAVVEETVAWTKWLVDTVGFDGFRVDAVRHMHSPFVADWSRRMRSYLAGKSQGGEQVLVFGENWDGWDARLDAYLKGSTNGSNREFHVRRDDYNGIERSMSLLDVPLHYAFQKVSGENQERMDIQELPRAGLVALSPSDAVTFVDNHDTIPTQPLASYISVHTKLQAYAFILLGDRGTPCVFYRDLYKGNFTGPYANDNVSYLYEGISKLLEARAKYAYGASSYYGAPGLLGHKRSGDGRGHAGSKSSGVITLMRQFDRNGNATTSSTTLTIPDDGRDWTLFAGSGTRNGNQFTIAPGAKVAVWVPAR